MLLPKFAIGDQVLTIRGEEKVVFIITGITQSDGHSPYRYESTVGSTTNYISEPEVVAQYREGAWVRI